MDEDRTQHHTDDSRMPALVAEAKDEMANERTREFMRVLEARKLEADEVELPHLHRLLAYLKYKLDPTHIHTSSHEIDYWDEKRAEDRDMYVAEHRDELERAFPRREPA